MNTDQSMSSLHLDQENLCSYSIEHAHPDQPLPLSLLALAVPFAVLAVPLAVLAMAAGATATTGRSASGPSVDCFCFLLALGLLKPVHKHCGQLWLSTHTSCTNFDELKLTKNSSLVVEIASELFPQVCV